MLLAVSFFILGYSSSYIYSYTTYIKKKISYTSFSNTLEQQPKRFIDKTPSNHQASPILKPLTNSHVLETALKLNSDIQQRVFRHMVAEPQHTRLSYNFFSQVVALDITLAMTMMENIPAYMKRIFASLIYRDLAKSDLIHALDWIDSEYKLDGRERYLSSYRRDYSLYHTIIQASNNGQFELALSQAAQLDIPSILRNSLMKRVMRTASKKELSDLASRFQNGVITNEYEANSALKAWAAVSPEDAYEYIKLHPKMNNHEVIQELGSGLASSNNTYHLKKYYEELSNNHEKDSFAAGVVKGSAMKGNTEGVLEWLTTLPYTTNTRMMVYDIIHEEKYKLDFEDQIYLVDQLTKYNPSSRRAYFDYLSERWKKTKPNEVKKFIKSRQGYNIKSKTLKNITAEEVQ